MLCTRVSSTMLQGDGHPCEVVCRMNAHSAFVVHQRSYSTSYPCKRKIFILPQSNFSFTVNSGIFSYKQPK